MTTSWPLLPLYAPDTIIVNGEINKNLIFIAMSSLFSFAVIQFLCYSVPLLPTTTATQVSTNTLVQTNPVMVSTIKTPLQQIISLFSFIITVFHKQHSCGACELFNRSTVSIELFTITNCNTASGWEWIYCYW